MARPGLSGIVVVGRRDGSPPFSLLPPERGEERREGGRSADGAARTLRHRRRRTKGRIAAVFSPPPGKGRSADGAARTHRHHRRRTKGRIAAVFSPPPWEGEERRWRGQDSPASSLLDEETDRRRFHSSPLPGGRSGGGLTRAPQTGRGVPPTASASPPPDPFSSPLEGGPGGMTRRRPPRAPAPDPPPDLPPGRGEERRVRGEERRRCGQDSPASSSLDEGADRRRFLSSPLKGGGAQTVRPGLSGIVVVGRRGGSPPFSLLPSEGGRSADGAARTLRHHRRWTKGRIAAVFTPPPYRGEESRRRGPPPCSAIESVPERGPDSSPVSRGRSEDEFSSAIALSRPASALDNPAAPTILAGMTPPRPKPAPSTS